MSRADRSGQGRGDRTVADPDLLTGRLFFAVAVPGASRAPLEAALPRLEPMLPGIPPARLRLGGAGTFPEGRKARVLWTGIGGDAEVLVRLAAALSAAGKAAGLRSEERPLVPHLTLARFSTPGPVPSEALDLVAGAAAASPSWEARELACYRSTLGGPRGARYRVVREFPLTG